MAVRKKWWNLILIPIDRSVKMMKSFTRLAAFTLIISYYLKSDKSDFTKFYFYESKKIVLKWKIVQSYKTSWNPSKFIDIYNITIELDSRDGLSCQYGTVREFLIFNRSLNLALHRTPPFLFSVETKKNHFKEFLDCL